MVLALEDAGFFPFFSLFFQLHHFEPQGSLFVLP